MPELDTPVGLARAAIEQGIVTTIGCHNKSPYCMLSVVGKIK